MAIHRGAKLVDRAAVVAAMKAQGAA